MTPGGWITLSLSIGAVTLLFTWCIWKVLRTPDSPDGLHGFTLKTPDEEEDQSPHRKS